MPIDLQPVIETSGSNRQTLHQRIFERGARGLRLVGSRCAGPDCNSDRLLSLHIYTSRPHAEMRAHACRGRGLPGLPWCLHLRPLCMPTGVVTTPLEAKLVAVTAQRMSGEPGRDARMAPGVEKGSRMAGTPAGRPTIQGNPRPREGNQPGIIQRAGAPVGGQALGTPRRSRPGTVRVAEAREDATARGRSRSCPGVTLGDEGGQGERTRSRHSVLEQSLL